MKRGKSTSCSLRWSNLENTIIRENITEKNAQLAKMIFQTTGRIRSKQAVSNQKGFLKRGVANETKNPITLPEEVRECHHFPKHEEQPSFFSPLTMSFDAVEIGGRHFAVVDLSKYEIISGDAEKTGFVMIAQK